MYSDGRSRDPRASVQACFFMRKPPVAMSAEDSKWHGCAPQGGPHVRWPCEALSKSAGGTQQAALSPMLKTREQIPLTEGRSSGGMSEKPSRLYGAKI